MIDAIQTAQQGIARHMESLNGTAENIARGSSDLAADAVQVKLDSIGVKYNVAMIQVASEMEETLIDIVA